MEVGVFLQKNVFQLLRHIVLLQKWKGLLKNAPLPVYTHYETIAYF